MPSSNRKKGKSDKSKRLSTSSSKSQPASSPPVNIDVSRSSESMVQHRPSTGKGESSHDALLQSPEPAPVNNPKEKESTPQSDPPNVFEFLDTENHSSSNTESEEEYPLPNPQLRSPRIGVSPTMNSSRHVNARDFSNASKDSVDDVLPTGSKIAIDSFNDLDVNKIAGAYQQDDESGQGSMPIADDDQFLLSSPESYYIPSRINPPLRDLPSPPPSLPEKSGSLTVFEKKTVKKLIRSGDLLSSAHAGYAYLALSLDSSINQGQRLPPLYRKFEALNHRVLLYLQDEISQLEEELQYLDGCEEKQRHEIAHEEGTKPTLSSRRADIQSRRHSELHRRRTDVLEQLTVKTHEYNTALVAYSKVVQTLPRASRKDVDFYRRWIHKNNPIAKPETRFLQYDLDLISLTVSVGARHETNVLYFLVGVLVATLLLPVLSY